MRNYLNQVYKLDKLIEAKEREIERVKDALANISSVLDEVNVQSSKRHDKLERNVIKLVDLIEDYQKEVAEAMETRKEITDLIYSLDNVDYIKVLELKYLHFKNWYDIAEIMGYSYKYTLKVHRLAINKIEKRKLICS